MGLASSGDKGQALSKVSKPIVDEGLIAVG
jgi:hypothetical protein